MIPSLLLDIAALATLCVCAVFFARRGFLPALVSFLGTLLALVAAVAVARTLAPVIFENFFRPGLLEQVESAVAGQEIYDIEQIMAAVFGFLPESLREQMAGMLQGGLPATSDMAAAVVDQVVAPIVTPFIIIILFLVFFVLLRLLVWTLVRLVRGVVKVPVISTLNSALGAVAGVFIGALYVYLFFCLLWAYSTITGGDGGVNQTFGNSLVYGVFQENNIFDIML